MNEAWPIRVTRVLVILGLNAVPIWGFTEQQWTPGTTLALYWFQSLVTIPITALLIVLHRRATRKAGHYSGITVTRLNGGHEITKRTTFLDGFLWMSIPFVVAHGIFLAVLLGLIWRTAPGAVDIDDLRIGIPAMLNIMALGFAADVFQLAHRPFAWVRYRAQSLMQRTAVVHFAILLGMAVAAFSSRDAAAFFGVFLFLKLIADLGSELPQWEPEELPAWIVRAMNRIGGAGTDFGADWRKTRIEERAASEADERVDLVGIERR